MLIIPAIDLYDGNCVRLYQGKEDQITVYSDDPTAMAKHWEECGATRLHVVDLNGAFEGISKNLDIILEIQKQTSLFIEMGGGIRSADIVGQLLESGIHHVILGTMAQKSVSLTRSLIREFPGRIILGIDAKDGFVSVEGWTTKSTILATDLVDRYTGYPVADIIFTDISRDGTLQGPNMQSLRIMLDHTDIPVIASGGISCPGDIEQLGHNFGDRLEGVILGKSLYDKQVDLREAINIFQT